MTSLRIGLGLVVVFAVLAHGAAEVWAETTVILAAGVLLLLWAFLLTRNATPGERGLADEVGGSKTGVGIHLPPILWPVLALWLWAGAQLAAGISLDPFRTKNAFLLLGAQAMFLFLAAQAVRRQRHIERFAWFLLVFSFGVALLGILQHVSGTGKLYWVRPLMEGGQPFGPYVNRNHFAGFVELTAPIGLAVLLLRALPRDRLLLAGVLTLVPAGAVFLSASRGGILTLLVQVAVLGVAAAKGRGGKPLFTLMLLALAGGAFVVWLGVQGAWERIAVGAPDDITSDRRAVMVRDTWRMIGEHRWTGVGAGAFVTAYPQYESYHDGKVVDHAHNDYLELVAETGVLGGLGGLAFVFLLFRDARRRLQESAGGFVQAVRLGAAVGCAGLLLHGLVDFNLQLPANALLFLLLAHLATLAPAARHADS